MQTKQREAEAVDMAEKSREEKTDLFWCAVVAVVVL